MHSGTHLQS